MTGAPSSQQIRHVTDALGAFAGFVTDPALERALSRPEACDFVFGNPHDLPVPGYVEALTRGLQPTGPDHYAYTMNEPTATATIAEGLRERFGMPFAAEDITMTNGNFAGLSIVLRVVADPGDEVAFVSPPWFFYESLIVAAGATPVRILADRSGFDLDLDAIAATIGPRTRAIIVNSPNNPSGRIYPPQALDELARILTEASARNGRPIYLLSDEAYNRILFDGRTFPTPTAHYPSSFLIYTYAKTLLAPGSRLGYVAVPPTFPERADLRMPMLVAAITLGWAFPVAPLQYAVPELESLTVDLAALQRRRDAICGGLAEQGYDLIVPEGTFYVTVRSPLPDDAAFCRSLAERDVYVLPGHTFELPGWFRISLTANDGMVERAIPRFGEALARARG